MIYMFKSKLNAQQKAQLDRVIGERIRSHGDAAFINDLANHFENKGEEYAETARILKLLRNHLLEIQINN